MLASASPRRARLLREAGIEFETSPADIDETRFPDEDPFEYVVRLAVGKARAAWRPGTRSLGADTAVVIDSDVLGKPADPSEARRMLQSLSGRCHSVLTGVAVFDGAACRSFSVETLVCFRELTDADIDAYVASGEPMDKAGAYGIQSGAAAFVARVDGSYTNVVGLPMDEVLAVLG